MLGFAWHSQHFYGDVPSRLFCPDLTHHFLKKYSVLTIKLMSVPDPIVEWGHGCTLCCRTATALPPNGVIVAEGEDGRPAVLREGNKLIIIRRFRATVGVGNNMVINITDDNDE